MREHLSGLEGHGAGGLRFSLTSSETLYRLLTTKKSLANGMKDKRGGLPPCGHLPRGPMVFDIPLAEARSVPSGFKTRDSTPPSEGTVRVESDRAAGVRETTPSFVGPAPTK